MLHLFLFTVMRLNLIKGNFRFNFMKRKKVKCNRLRFNLMQYIIQDILAIQKNLVLKFFIVLE